MVKDIVGEALCFPRWPVCGLVEGKTELFLKLFGYQLRNLGCRRGLHNARGDVEVYGDFPNRGGPCLMHGERYRHEDGLVSVLRTTGLLHVIGISSPTTSYRKSDLYQ
jgi:hypothetical protein